MGSIGRWLLGLVITGALAVAGYSLWTARTSQSSSLPAVNSAAQQASEDPAQVGMIVVDGGSGLISTTGGSSYIGESARGTEAYLAEGGVSATYSVSSPTAMQYQVLVKLSDDAVHDTGARSATLVVNGGAMLPYQHVSEDTKGWKWYSLGNVSLNAGENSFVFTKNESTFAAYVMDEFRLLPLP